MLGVLDEKDDYRVIMMNGEKFFSHRISVGLGS